MSELESKILKVTNCGVCLLAYDPSFSVEYASDPFYSLLDCNAGVAAHQTSLKLLLAEKDFAAWQQAVQENLLQHNFDFDYEFSIKSLKRNFVWFILKCHYTAADKLFFCLLVDVTLQKEREEALRISEEAHRISVAHYKIMTLRYYVSDNTVVVPKEIAEFFGIPETLLNWPYNELVHKLVPESSLKNYISFFEDIQAGKPSGSVVTELWDGLGRHAWYRGNYTTIYNYEGAPYCGVISLSDATEQREKELAYEKWVQIFRAQEADSIGYYEANLSKDVFEKSSGILKSLLSDLDCAPFSLTTQYVAKHWVFAEDKEKYLAIFNREWLLEQYLLKNRTIKVEYRRLDSNAQPFWVQVVVQMFEDPFSNDIRSFTILKDIDAEKRARLELEERSQVDMLTGLLNRGSLVDKIKEILAAGSDTQHAFVMIDLDYFKKLNDTLGHSMGDTMLQGVAEVLRQSVRSEDIIGRLGGDEFIVFMKNIKNNTALCEKMSDICKRLYKKYVKNITITASLGVALFPQDGQTFEELYLHADTALYEAKRHGRNKFVIYDQKNLCSKNRLT